MAKGRGHNRKKEARRGRAERRAAQGRAGGQTGPTLTQRAAATATTASQSGLASLRGSVSGAYRTWAVDYGRRQAEAMRDQFPATDAPASGEVFLLAPLT